MLKFLSFLYLHLPSSSSLKITAIIINKSQNIHKSHHNQFCSRNLEWNTVNEFARFSSFLLKISSISHFFVFISSNYNLASTTTTNNNNIHRISKRPKRTNNNGTYFPLSLLGEVAAGVIPFNGYGFHRLLSANNGGSGSGASAGGSGNGNGGCSNDFRSFSASWCTEVSCSPREVEETDSKRREKGGGGSEKTRPVASVADESPRPPLVRTSRGRAQVLCPRFKDSILDDLKKDKTTTMQFLCTAGKVEEGRGTGT